MKDRKEGNEWDKSGPAIWEKQTSGAERVSGERITQSRTSRKRAQCTFCFALKNVAFVDAKQLFEQETCCHIYRFLILGLLLPYVFVYPHYFFLEEADLLWTWPWFWRYNFSHIFFKYFCIRRDNSSLRNGEENGERCAGKRGRKRVHGGK